MTYKLLKINRMDRDFQYSVNQKSSRPKERQHAINAHIKVEWINNTKWDVYHGAGSAVCLYSLWYCLQFHFSAKVAKINLNIVLFVGRLLTDNSRDVFETLIIFKLFFINLQR